jgi:hypothetical protein
VAHRSPSLSPEQAEKKERGPFLSPRGTKLWRKKGREITDYEPPMRGMVKGSIYSLKR